MANYCVKCGKELPEGADTCPVCNSAGQESDAALFTQITAATEAWKKTEEPKEKPKRTPQQKQLLAYSLGAAAFLLIAVLAILYIQPVNRVIRAINAGHYSQAKEIYWSDRGLVSGRHDEEINRALLRAAEKLTNEYADGKISGDDAARALATLGSIGTQAESLLSDSFAEFRTFNDSRDHLAEAEKLSLNGDYLGARDEYLRVLEGDANYAAAMESADASLEYYAESVLSSADLLIQSGDYGAAISAMEEAERKLLDYEVYNEKLDYKLTATYGLYEEELLSKASALAAQQEYSEAAKLLQQGMSDYDYSTDALTAAVEKYVALSREKKLADTVAQAETLYADGDAEGAFALLDATIGDEEIPQETAEAEITALEERFSADTIAKARTAFARDRDSLPGAISLLNDALHIRRLETIEDYKEDVSRYLPANLSEVEYAEKDGTIFRSASEFEALSGVTYTQGWIWGEDGASVTFELNGGYDLLEGSFTVRRENEAEAGASFEILCDGEVVYTSPTVQHLAPETVPVSVSVSGCKILVIRFSNDYSVRTADDGYCYHGFCDAFLTKDIQ